MHRNPTRRADPVRRRAAYNERHRLVAKRFIVTHWSRDAVGEFAERLCRGICSPRENLLTGTFCKTWQTMKEFHSKLTIGGVLGLAFRRNGKLPTPSPFAS